jgi:hypothetical protein
MGPSSWTSWRVMHSVEDARSYVVNTEHSALAAYRVLLQPSGAARREPIGTAGLNSRPLLAANARRASDSSSPRCCSISSASSALTDARPRPPDADCRPRGASRRRRCEGRVARPVDAAGERLAQHAGRRSCQMSSSTSSGSPRRVLTSATTFCGYAG